MEEKVIGRRRIVLYDDYNAAPRGGEIIGTVVQQFSRSAWKNGWKLIELYED